MTEEMEIRKGLEERYGKVYTGDDIRRMQRDEFEVLGFQAPYMIVKSKTTGKQGSLEFTHSPRFYFNLIWND